MHNLQRSNLDGTNVETLVPAIGSSCGIAVDLLGGKIYWTEDINNKIQRSNLDGSNVEDLVTGLEQPIGIALDVAGGKMYWADEGSDKIQRANLDGSEVEDLITAADGIDNPQFPALDLTNNKIYWADNAIGNIQRANLDGSNIEELITFLLPVGHPEGLALDLIGGKMYWANFTAGKIQRANLDGSDIEDVITGLNNPRSIALQLYSTVDTDGDGIPDGEDDCPNSDLSPTVVIDGCDSGVDNELFDDGCTISDNITELADSSTSHGSFTSAVSHLTNELKKDGVISGKQKGAIQSCAGQADILKPLKYEVLLTYSTDGDGNSWIHIQLMDKHQRPVALEDYELFLPDGSVAEGTLDENGEAQELSPVPGTAVIDFPNLDPDSGERV